MLYKRNPLKYKDTNRFKEKRWKEICHANINQKKAEITILISDNADFRARKFIREKGIT